MSHAEICPVCKGRGKVFQEKDPNSSIAENQWVTCHGCGGKGWITVGNDYPYVPSPEPWPDPNPWKPCPQPWRPWPNYPTAPKWNDDVGFYKISC